MAAAPLGRSNWAWAAFAGLGLATAVAFWVAPTWRDAQPSLPAAPVPAAAAQAPGDEAPQTTSAPNAVATPPANAGDTARPRKGDRVVATPRTRDRQGVARVLTPAEPVAAPPVSQQGKVQLAISPWGQIEVDGVAAGTTPPLSQLTLPTGTHRIVVRNDDFPPFTTQVTVIDDKPVTLRHRFGS
jgi:serine/threonine-protein kinase